MDVESRNNVLRGTAVEVGESIVRVDSSSRFPQRRTLELAPRIGRRALKVLVDSGSTGYYIDAQECAAQRIRIEDEDHAEELKMSDGLW